MDVLTRVADGIATIAMNRPAKKNALTAPMYRAMADALRAGDADPAVRCIVTVSYTHLTLPTKRIV